MPSIGNRTVSLHTVDRDETKYIGPSHTISHKDEYALRRTLPTTATGITRTQLRAERSFPVPGVVDGLEKPVTVSIAVSVPPGVVPADVETYVADTLTQAATTVGDFAISGDIHLG